MSWYKYNANPKGWKDGDCVIRSVSSALNQDWSTTFGDLCKIAAKKCRMPNSEQVYNKYLEDHGFIKMKQLKHDDGTKYTVQEVANEHEDCILLIHCAHHLTCAVGGRIVDTWYCGRKTAGRYWLFRPTKQEDIENLNELEYKLMMYYQ